MTEEIDLELIEIAEQHREFLTDDFFEYRSYVEDSFQDKEWPNPLLSRGGKIGKLSKIVDAVLEELYLLLCSNHKRYKEVRKQGKAFSKIALPAVASYIGATFGISIGMATGFVGFLSISVFKIGTGVFCRLREDQLICEKPCESSK